MSRKLEATQNSVGSSRQGRELLQATDAAIDAAVKYTDPMALRGLVYQLTGDEELERVAVARNRVFFAEAFTPASDADTATIQRKAADFLKAHRNRGAQQIGHGPPARLPRSLELTAGEPLTREEIGMWSEETALDPWARALQWPAPPPRANLEAFSVLVIGAGMGGLGAAVQLKRAGIPFRVIERRSDLGGTWYENRYPGARVDTPSGAYTHLFAAGYPFSSPFAPQRENEAYFHDIADRFGLRSHITFDTEVRDLTWDEAAQRWRVRMQGPDGEQEITANGVICAVGIYSTPLLPRIPGAEQFAGSAFHTSRWPRGLDTSDRRIAVIGTGATGYQLIPELAKQARHVYVCQRKPQWVFPVPGYLGEFPPQVRWLDRNFPYHLNFMRFRTNWVTGERIYAPIFNRDPTWRDEHTGSAVNQRIRDARIAYIREKFAARPELIDKMIPPHPPFSARPILVDEEYNIYDALLRENVTLVSGGIDRITPHGIVSGGVEYPVDAIAYATGFQANNLLFPMQIRGRDGRTVQELWAKDGARAYVCGSMLTGFPNLFVLYGPNTNPGHGGGIVNLEEIVIRFALECFGQLITTGQRSIDVTREAFERYNRELDVREAMKLYTDKRAQNFYTNEFGRSSVMLPFGPSELWNKLHPLRLDEFRIE